MTDISLRQYAVELEVLLDHEALEEAIGHCQHILKHYPKNVATYRTLGWALLGKARFDQAGDIFRRVLSVEPGDKDAHRGLAMVYRDLKNWAQAIWHMERAFEQDPNNVDIQKRLRELYSLYQDGDYGKLQLTRGALARMYLQSGLHEKAITELQNALHDHPERIDLRVLLARALWESTYPIEAGETATEVIRVLPYCLEANRILAALWLKNGRPSDAQPFLARVEAVDPYAALALVGEELEQDPFVLPRLDWTMAEARQVASQTPDWVQSIADALERPEDVRLAGDQSVPDWMMADSGATAPPARADVGGLFDSLEANETGGALPDWMSQPVQDMPTGAADLDWMSVMQGNPPSPDQAAGLPPGFEDWSAPAELPSVQASIPTPPPDELDFLNGMEPPAMTADWLPDSSPEPAPPIASTPDWLADLGVGADGGLVSPEPEAQPETPATPDWFADVQAAAFGSTGGQDEELPWLQGAPAEPVQPTWTDSAPVEPPEEHPVPRLPVEPGQRVPTGFTGLLSALKSDDEDNDPLAWMNVPDARVSREHAEASAEAPRLTETDDLPLSALDEDSPDATAMLRRSVMGGSSLLDEPAEPVEDPLAWLQIPDDDEEAEEAGAGPLDAGFDSPAPRAGGSDPLAWLYSEDEEAILDEAGFEVPLAGPAAAPEDPLAWLNAGTGMLDAGTDKDNAMTPTQPEPGPADWQEPEADDWLSGLGGQPAQQPEPEPEPSGLPDWLSQAKPAEPAPEDDWLSQAKPAEPAPEDDWLAGISLGGPEPAASGAPDSDLGWLGEVNREDKAAEEAGTGIPDWLQGAPEAPAAADTPDWLGMAEEAAPSTLPPAPEIGAPARLDLPDTPDWLNIMDMGEEPAAAIPAEPESPAAEVPDWLSEMGGDAAEEVPAEPALPPAEMPDWLSEMAGGEEEETPAEPALPVAEMPDWLSGMAPAEGLPAEETPVEAVSAQGFPVEEEQAPEPELPLPAAPSGVTSWLDGIQTPAAALPETDWLGALASDEKPAEAGAMPDWLSGMAPAEELPAAEEFAEEEPVAEAGATPDWLSMMAPAEELPVEEEAGEEPVAEAGATPDWLSKMAPAEELPVEELAGEEPVAEAGATPDWLSMMAPAEELPAEEELAEEEPVAEAGATPDWLSMMAPAEELPAEEEAGEELVAEAGATRDWLSAMGSFEEEIAEEVEAEVEELPVAEAGATHDWLRMMAPAEELPAEEAAEEAPVAEAGTTPDWLSMMAPAEELPAEEELAGEEPVAEAGATPDWLSMMAPAEELPAEEEAEEAPVAEAGATPDWLSAMAPAEELPVEEEEAEEEPVAEAGATPDWLSAMGSFEEETAEEIEAEVEELPVAEAGATPDWLSMMAPAEALPAEELAGEEPVAEAGTTPDWLSGMAPAEELPLEELPAEEKAEEAAVTKRTPMPLSQAAEAPVEAALLAEEPAAEEEAVPLAEADPARWAMREVLQAQMEAIETAEAAIFEEPAVSLEGTQPVGVDATLEAAEIEADLPLEPGALPVWLSDQRPLGADADLEAAEPIETSEVAALVDTAEAPAGEFAPLETTERPLAEPEAAAEADALPDWLSAMAVPADELAPLEVAEDELGEFDLLEVEAEVEPESAAEPGALPDWLSAMAAPAEAFEPLAVEAEAEPEVAAEEGAPPDWLSDSSTLQTVETTPVQEPGTPETPSVVTGEKVTIHDTLEWLSDMGSLDAEEMEGVEGQTLPVADTGPGWLRDVGMFQPEETPEAEEEAAPEPAPARATRFAFDRWVPVWMSGSMAPQTPATAAPPPDTAPEFDLDLDDDDEFPDFDLDANDDESGPSWLRPVMEDDDDLES